MIVCDVLRFGGVGLVVKKFDENRSRILIAMIAPNDQPVSIGPHCISHQVLFEQIAVPFVPLLCDNPTLDLFDQRSKPSFPHAL